MSNELLTKYINSLNNEYKTGRATEHSYRSFLKELFENLMPFTTAINEPTRSECGAPDFVINKKNIPVGYAEAKDVNCDLYSKSYKEQFDRYKNSLENLIITNYLDFQFFRNGELIAAVSIGFIENNTILPKTEYFDRFIDLINSFYQYSGITIRSASKLSKLMAGKAKMLAEVIENALKQHELNVHDIHESSNNSLFEQMKSFRKIIIHDITAKEFADIYAQTIAYGMFAARLSDESPEDFSRQEAAELIPKSNPFLRKLFQYIAGYDLDERIKWIVDDLANLFKAVNLSELMKDFGKASQQDDPIIHFYETFLSEYDPNLRKSRGVWYTPLPVVNFIVKAVDEILKNDFGLSKGLVDNRKIKIKTSVEGYRENIKGSAKLKNVEIEEEVHKVQILDPATGTGTFLASVVNCIYESFKKQKGLWNNYVEEHLIPRLNGFELLMASYAMAHLKLELLLKGTGYTSNKNQRLKIFLTNSLEEYHEDTGSLFASWLSAEAHEANHIKRDTPVMVVLGNPPYSVSSSNKGDWIQNLTADYKKDLNERNIQPLSDDYIKFIRYGQHYIEKNGEGILAYISNNSFIDGIIHRQMRKSLLETFDKIYILDLHGNSKKKETAPDGSKDENVFDIQQGVSINIFIKTGKSVGVQASACELAGVPPSGGKEEKKHAEACTPTNLARVFHYDLYGLRKDKYEFLQNNNLNSINWNILEYKAPEFFFVKKNMTLFDNYDKYIDIKELFKINGMGITTGKDSKFIFYKKNDLPLCYESKFIKFIYYRLFDDRLIYYNTNIIERPRRELMRHMQYHDYKNYGLLSLRGVRNNITSKFGITNKIIDKSVVSTLDNCYIFPLYQYSESGEQRSPNLNMEIVNKIAEKLGLEFVTEPVGVHNSLDRRASLFSCAVAGVPPSGGKEKSHAEACTPTSFSPIDILDYIYAVLHSPSYREKYKEFLKIDFPRVPYPKDTETFWELVKLGGQLRSIHLMESEILDNFITGFPISGTNEVESVKYKDEKVWINAEQFFEDVPEIAWNFYIGGYQPAQKWLKDRKGRTLDFEDITHYQKIIVALVETDKLMKIIEKIVIE